MARTLSLVLSLILSGFAWAAGGGGDGGPPSTYLALDPAFVLNLGEAEDGGRSYMKVEVTLRFHEAALRKQAEDHRPWLRHELVMLMSGQPIKPMQSAEGQAKLRREARAVLNERLAQEMPKAWKAFQEKQQTEAAEAQSEEEEKKATEEKEGSEASSGDDSAERGMIREVLFPNFIVQVR